MLQNKKLFSLYHYFKREYRYVIFFTLFFSLVSILLSVAITPVFNAKSRVYVSGSSSLLASISSQIPFSLGGASGALTDEMELINSNDLKRIVFSESDLKINWGKVDPKIRHGIVFDSIPLHEGPKQLKIEVKSKNSFSVYISKDYKGIGKIKKKLLPTSYDKYCDGVSGEMINVRNSFNFIITSADLAVGDNYVFEIDYKFPKFVESKLYNIVSFVNEDMSSIFDITTAYTDPIKVVDINISFYENYIEQRYKDVVKNRGEIVKIIDKKIIATKQKVDSLSLENKRLSIKYKTLSPELEAEEIYKNFGLYTQARSNLVMNKKMTDKFSPYDSIKIRSNNIQIAVIDEELETIKSKLYDTYPSAIVEFFNVKYQLQAEAQILADLLVKKESASITEIMEIGNRKLFQKPTYPFSRAKPQRGKMLVTYFVFGFFVGIGYLIFRKFIHRKVIFQHEFIGDLKFTVANSATESEKVKYLNRKVIPLLKDDTLVGFYRECDEAEVSMLKESGYSGDIVSNIVSEMKFADKKNIAIVCKYNEVYKKDLMKIEDKFDDRIIWVIYDIDYNSSEYFYDKFADDYFEIETNS